LASSNTAKVKERWVLTDLSLDQYCPECGGLLLFDSTTKRYGCKSCGLFLTREQLSDIRYKMKTPQEDVRRKKQREQSDYLEWWLSGKKEG